MRLGRAIPVVLFLVVVSLLLATPSTGLAAPAVYTCEGLDDPYSVQLHAAVPDTDEVQKIVEIREQWFGFIDVNSINPRPTDEEIGRWIELYNEWGDNLSEFSLAEIPRALVSVHSDAMMLMYLRAAHLQAVVDGDDAVRDAIKSEIISVDVNLDFARADAEKRCGGKEVLTKAIGSDVSYYGYGIGVEEATPIVV